MHTPQTIDPFRAATLARQYRRAAATHRRAGFPKDYRTLQRMAREQEARVRELADSIIAGA